MNDFASQLILLSLKPGDSTTAREITQLIETFQRGNEKTVAGPAQVRSQQQSGKTTSIHHQWGQLARRVIERQAAPLVLHRLRTCELTHLLPPSVISLWEKAAWKTLSRKLLLSDEFVRVARAFTGAGIQFIPMKGICLSEELYPSPGMRQFSDIDILVHEADSDAAVAELHQMGYKEAGIAAELPPDVHALSDASHRPPLVRKGIMVEIHTRVHRRREDWQVDHDDLWRTAVETRLYGQPVKVFSRTYQLLTVAIHHDKHFREGKFQMTGYYDMVHMLRQWSSEIEWEELLRLCDEARCAPAVLTHLALIAHYAGVEVPEQVQQHAAYRYSKAQAATFEEGLATGKAHQLLTMGSLNPVTKIVGWRNKLRYVWFYLFPPVSFLMKQYGLSRRGQVWKYYPYRVLRRIAKLGLTVWHRVTNH